MTQASGWQLSGTASQAYERYIVQAFMQGWTHSLLDVATLTEGARVLDAACGTGVVARQAARRVGNLGHVAGVDLNAGMLAMARTPAVWGLHRVEGGQRHSPSLSGGDV